MSFLKGLFNFIKVAGPVICLCSLWISICTRRENMMAAIHELSEIGLSSVIYHHDQAFDNQAVHDGRIHLHNTNAKMRLLHTSKKVKDIGRGHHVKMNEFEREIRQRGVTVMRDMQLYPEEFLKVLEGDGGWDNKEVIEHIKAKRSSDVWELFKLTCLS